MNYYFNRGFSQVSFEASATPDADDPQRMNVVYHLQEGEQIFVDRILMSGLDNTKPGIAERQFQFQSGDPLSQTAMLETQRRLYDLGVFNEVKLAVQNSEGDAKYKNILLQFTEARRWTFNYGVGLEIQSGGFGCAYRSQRPDGSQSHGQLRCEPSQRGRKSAYAELQIARGTAAAAGAGHL